MQSGRTALFRILVLSTVVLGTLTAEGPAGAATPRTVYVANISTDNVTPIAVATNSPATPITVGDGPIALAITPDGATAYVANTTGGTVTPVTTATNTAGTPIAVGGNP